MEQTNQEKIYPSSEIYEVRYYSTNLKQYHTVTCTLVKMRYGFIIKSLDEELIYLVDEEDIDYIKPATKDGKE